jgi:iron(III) transport system ATP-binding protein
MNMLIQLRDVNKRFGAVQAVRGLSLDVPRGSLFALLGASGCGKTTTLRLLAGLEKPDSGEVVLNGRTVAGPGAWAPPEARRVGMVFQDYALFPHLTVTENVAFGLRSRDPRRVAEMLALVGLSGLGARYPHELSGGQQQRVALARALAPQPEIVLLDEPFSNLDAALRKTMRADVRDILRAANATAVFVTHDQEEALSLAEVVAVMEAGALVQVAAPHELYLRPATRALAEFLGEANFLPGLAEGGAVETALGRLALAQPLTGPVQVMVRPEMLTLTPVTNGGYIVEQATYYGHDQLVHVRVGDELRLAARDWGQVRLAPGARVEVRVNEAVTAYRVNGSH